MASQLGVRYLVTPLSKCRLARHALDEVRNAPPPSLEEDSLVDHFGAGAHRFNSLLRRALPPTPQLARREGAALDLDDAPARVLQELEMRCLVLLAFAAHQVGRRVARSWALDLTAPHGELQLGEVLALEEVIEVRRGEDHLSAHARVSAVSRGRRLAQPVHSHRCAFRK